MDKLEELRKKIDEVDQELIKVFIERFKVVEEIGAIKKELGLKPLDEKRWQKMIENRVALAEDMGLDADFIRALYTIIHSHSIDIQNDIVSKNE